jgi:hypothetical protein
MADQLKLQLLAQLTETDTNEVHRYLDEVYLTTPKSYYSGKEFLTANEADSKMAEGVNTFIATSTKKFTLKIGSIGAQAMPNTFVYVYTGDPQTFFITNPNSEPIEIKIVTAKLDQ